MIYINTLCFPLVFISGNHVGNTLCNFWIKRFGKPIRYPKFSIQFGTEINTLCNLSQNISNVQKTLGIQWVFHTFLPKNYIMYFQHGFQIWKPVVNIMYLNHIKNSKIDYILYVFIWFLKCISWWEIIPFSQWFEHLLKTHPNRPLINSVCRGLWEGFWPYANIDLNAPDTFDFSERQLTDAGTACVQQLCDDEIASSRYSKPFGSELLLGMYSEQQNRSHVWKFWIVHLI